MSRSRYQLFTLALVAVAAFLPSALTLLTYGRPTGMNAVVRIPGLLAILANWSVIAIGIVASIGILVFDKNRLLPAHRIMPLLAFTGILCLASARGVGRSNPVILVTLIVIVLYSYVGQPSTLIFRHIASGYAAVAGFSIALGLLVPEVGLIESTPGQDKIFASQSLLAGPFIQANILGLFICSGLPFVWALASRGSKLAHLMLMVPAILWSGSRTSAIAMAACLVVMAGMWISFRIGRLLALLFILAGFSLTVALPFNTGESTSYSGRGNIWRSSLDAWQERPILGWGTRFYAYTQEFYNSFGSAAFHGHNLLINTLVVTGLSGALFLSLSLFQVFRIGLQLHTGGTTHLLFMVFLAWASILETTIPLDGPPSLVYFSLISLLIFAKGPPSSPAHASTDTMESNTTGLARQAATPL